MDATLEPQCRGAPDGADRPLADRSNDGGRLCTTKSRLKFFMNEFRKLGFIEHNGGLKIHTSLLSVVLHD